MKLHTVACILLLASLLIPAAAQTKPAKAASQKHSSPGEVVDRVGDTGFVQIHAESFRALTPKEKELAYWLTQAAIAIDPIIYDQLSWYGLRQKRLLEEIVSHPQGTDAAVMTKITDFAKVFWGNRGNHNDLTSQKFLPDFSFDELQSAALQAQKNGAFQSSCADLPALPTPTAVTKEVGELKQSLFDPDFEPMITAKSPQGGKDIIQSSSNTFYGPGVTLADLKDFKGKYAENSRVVRGAGGELKEEVYRAGTPDGAVPPGLYATYLKRANEYLAKAQAVADPQQAAVIGALIRYYQTGEYGDLLTFDRLWVQNNAKVDFANNFIEIYRDANGMKASSQAFVSVTDNLLSSKAAKLASNAAYFEQNAPWDAKYKRTAFTPPTVKAIETIVETGDFSVTTIGDNLPNENEIHEKYGSKNFLFTGSSRALTAAVGTKVIREFGANEAVIQRYEKYGQQADELFTTLHEVIGHGSGKLSDRLKGGSESYLKEYYSTMEEGRADLSALWNAWDPKLKELGLIEGNQDEVAKAMYDSAALVMLTQLRRIPKGDTIEEDHQRDRALIANYVMDKTGGIRTFERNGETYVEVADYQKMRQGVGMLLSELMRIKAEGDYNAIKALVDRYGVHFDPKLRDQVVQRYKALNLPTYWVGVNAQLVAKTAGGKVQGVEMIYPRSDVHQSLYYGSMYCKDLKLPAIKLAAPVRSGQRKVEPLQHSAPTGAVEQGAASTEMRSTSGVPGPAASSDSPQQSSANLDSIPGFQSIAILKERSARGDAQSQCDLGFIYEEGDGVPQDVAQAAFWYRKAAEQGNAAGQWALASLYESGRGVKQDYAEAYFWLDVAQAGKIEGVSQKDADALRHEAASHLAPADLSRVQERAQKWLAEHPTKANPE